MQVQSVNFNQAKSFKGYDDNIGFVNLNDSDIRQLAYLKTVSKADPKKHERVNNVMTMLLPVAGGLANAASVEKGARKMAFASGFGGWTAFLLGIGAVFSADRALKNKSEKYRNFAEKHSFLNIIGTMTASYFAGVAAQIAGAKGIKALASTKFYARAAEKVSKAMKNIGSKKFVLNVSDFSKSLIAKTPSALKNAAKFGAKIAPWALILGSIAHSVNYSSKFAKSVDKNYTDLKNQQLNLANDMRRDAEVQRDFLLQ